MMAGVRIDAAMAGLSESATAACDEAARWVLITVRSGAEQDARDSLRRHGLSVWWPNYEREVRGLSKERGRVRLVRSGVIPGVLLSPSLMHPRFHIALDRAPGVIAILRGAEGEIAELRSADIALLRAIEHGLNTPPTSRPAHSYKVGDRVRFAGDERRAWPAGRVVRVSKGGRLSVEVPGLFGRTTLVEVMHCHVEGYGLRPKNH